MDQNNPTSTISTGTNPISGATGAEQRQIQGFAKVTFEFLMPLYADSATSVPSLKEDLLNDSVRYGMATDMVENEEWRTEVELYPGTRQDAEAWLDETANQHGDPDDDIEDDPFGDDDDDEEDEEDEDA